ncbi:MAG: bifunctional DNA-formamidopyrimidine glycosylase/DNA-(apurinic or apyrimidinic site) lyase [Alphaproteobacteria bacterium]|nr:bifunctional DNA-formamidopyrimidine glycosylase/DNA-(apurinic or apyrimidinic site) lyase [Alphaproteobacteria bacterium]
MPELPEVETVRSALAPVMEGNRFARIEARRPDLRFPFPDDFEARLTNARVEGLGRRGKYLIADLSTGESLIMHLGMSGRFVIEGGLHSAIGPNGKAKPPKSKHDHVVFELTSLYPVRIIYNDPRRFGFMDLVPSDALEECRHFKAMGPEPLSSHFSAMRLNDALKPRAAPIKAVLLDQRVVAGLGNIYVCEALFRAGISPRRQAKSVAGRRGERLYGVIIDVLRDAIEAGGSSLKDFANADGELGYFQHRFDVYDREGEDCRICGKIISRIIQSGRSTFFCSNCQR